MTTKAILHAATRIVRRVTVDDIPSFDPNTELVQEFSEPFDLSDGYWKLDANGAVSRPSEQEIDDADIDPVKVEAKRRAFLLQYGASLDAIGAAATNQEIAAALKAFALLHKRLMLDVVGQL